MGKAQGGASTWLLTYSDMVTLLMVFFIVLYTMTPGVEDRAFTSFIQYFQKHTGFFDDSAISNETASASQSQQTENIIEENMEQWLAFADFLEEQKLASEIDIRVMSEGVLITLSDSLTFESGSSELLPKAEEVLDKVGELITERIQQIEVQGHTDNVPLSGNNLHHTNWHLGAARAVSVLQYLQMSANCPPDIFEATSFGEYRPVADNDTPEGRRENRRVEIYLRDKMNYENPDPIQDISYKEMNTE